MITLKDLKILGFKDFKTIFNIADHLLNQKIYKYTTQILNELMLGPNIVTRNRVFDPLVTPFKSKVIKFDSVIKKGNTLIIHLFIEDYGNNLILTIKEQNGLTINITDVVVNYDISFLSKNKKTVLSQILKETLVLILRDQLNPINSLQLPLYAYNTLKSRFKYYNKIT